MFRIEFKLINEEDKWPRSFDLRLLTIISLHPAVYSFSLLLICNSQRRFHGDGALDGGGPFDFRRVRGEPTVAATEAATGSNLSGDRRICSSPYSLLLFLY
ncbi:hypothetical protein M5689_007820 [Euphorbia peplus]|nr:hypothetical protein M5689_007820 [Euphorbia peplus]